MAWDFPDNAPRAAAYPSPDPNVVGNALANLVPEYQRAVTESQANQQGKIQLDVERAFQGGMPMGPDGKPDLAKIMQILAQKGDPNAIARLQPLLQEQQWISGATTSGLFGGAGTPGGEAGAPVGGFMGSLHQVESGNRNILSGTDKDYPGQPGSRSQGYDQIDVPTWQQFAPQAGVDINQYPTPMNAPEAVQDAVAAVIPFGRFGFNTRSTLEKEYGFTEADKGLTVGQLAARYGGGQAPAGGGTQVAGAGATDAPSIPPVSAAAGSAIPRAQQPSPQPQPAWAGGPQMGGINAVLPTGAGPPPAAAPPPQAGGQLSPGILGSLTGISPAEAGTLPPPPAQTASLPPGGGAAAPRQAGSVAQIVSSAVPDPRMAAQVAANVAKALRVDPAAPLTPPQAEQAAKYVAAYALRTRQQSQPAAPPVPPAPPSSLQVAGSSAPTGGPIVPQIPLPRGFTDPQAAIVAIDQEIARLSPNPYAREQVMALADWRDRIAGSAAPVHDRPGEAYYDPKSGREIFQVPYPGGNLSPAAVDQAAETYYQTGKFPTGMGRGMQGAGNIQMIMDRAQELHPNEPIETWPQRQQAFAAGSAGARTLSTRVRQFSLAENSASAVIPRVEETSKAVSRSQYPSLNRIIEMAKVGTGDPAMVRFGIAAETLAQAYARALTPVGQSTVSMQDHARSLLDQAWSQGQVEGALDQMRKEISSEKGAINKSLREAHMEELPEDDGQPSSSGGGGAGDSGLPPGWSVKVR